MTSRGNAPVSRFVRGSLAFAPFLMLLADTKFRRRDPGATLEGAIDAQVLFELAIFAFAGLLALRVLRAVPRLASQRNAAEGLLLAYALLALLSTAWSPIRMLTFVRASELLAVVLLAAAVVRLQSPTDVLRSLVRLVPLYVLLGSAAAFLLPGVVGGMFESYRGVSRFSWFAVHPSLAASFAAIAVILLVNLLSQRFATGRSLKGSIAVVALIVVFLVVIALTRARTESAALLVTLVAMALRRWIRPQSRVVLAALLTAAGIAFWVFVSPWISDAMDLSSMTESEITAFILRGQTIQELATVSGRMDLWRVILPLVFEAPLFGSGYMASRSVLLEAVPWASYAHNALLQSLLDLGLTGTVMIWGLALWALWKGASTPVGTRLETFAVGQMVFGVLVFQVLVAGAGESFVGVPGFRVFLFCICAMFAVRLWRSPGAAWR